MQPQNNDQVPQPPQSDPQSTPNSQSQPPQPVSPPPYPNSNPGANTPGTGPRSGPNKGLLFGIIGGVVGLLVLIVVIIMVVVSLGVSKEDYSEAHETATTVRRAYSDMSGVYISTYSTETEVKNQFDKFKENRKKLNENIAAFGELKAAKKDKEVKEAYDKLLAKKVKFDKAADATAEAYDLIYPAVTEFSSSAKSNSSNASLSSLRKSYEDISGLKDENNKEYVEKTIALLEKLEKLYEKVQIGRRDYRKYDSDAVTDYYAASREITDITRDWSSNLKKLADDGEIRDEITGLTDAINKKQYKSW